MVIELPNQPGGIAYNGLCRKASTRKGYLLEASVIKNGRITLVKAKGILSFLSVKGPTDALYGCERKCSGLTLIHILQGSFTAGKIQGIRSS